MAKKTFYGIRFPFTTKDRDNFFIDLDYQQHKQIKNNLMHILFTQKGSRLRDINFGTNLIKYIFNPSDQPTAFDIKLTIQKEIDDYLPNITITAIDVTPNETNAKIMDVSIKYKVSDGFGEYPDEIKTSL